MLEKGGTGLRVPSEDEVRVTGRAWVAGSTLELFDIGMGVCERFWAGC